MTHSSTGFKNVPGSRYAPSGQMPPRGILMVLLIGGLASAVAGGIYAALIWYNPFIYVNFLGSAAFAFLLGVAGTTGVKIGHLRSPTVAAALGALVGLMGLWASWVVWLYLLTGDGDESGLIIFSPGDMAAIISLVAENGVWSIKNFTPTGVVLYGLWAIEAGILLVGPSYLLYSAASEPYCEDCDAWAETIIEGLNLGPVQAIRTLEDHLMRGDMAPLRELGAPTLPVFARLVVSSCPGGRRQGFLSLMSVTITVNKKGESEEDTQDLIKNLVISSKAVADLKDLQANPPVAEPEPRGEQIGA